VFEFVYPYNGYVADGGGTHLLRPTGSIADLKTAMAESIQANTSYNASVNGNEIRMTGSVTGSALNTAITDNADLITSKTDFAEGTGEAGTGHQAGFKFMYPDNTGAEKFRLISLKDMSPELAHQRVVEGVHVDTGTPRTYYISSTGSADNSNGVQSEYNSRIKSAILHGFGTTTTESGSVTVHSGANPTFSFTGSYNKVNTHDWETVGLNAPAGVIPMTQSNSPSQGYGWPYISGTKDEKDSQITFANGGSAIEFRLTWPHNNYDAAWTNGSTNVGVRATGTVGEVLTAFHEAITGHASVGANYTLPSPTNTSGIGLFPVTASATGPSWNNDLNADAMLSHTSNGASQMVGGYDAYNAVDEDWLLLANEGVGNHLFKFDNNSTALPTTLPNKTHDITVTVDGEYALAGGLVTGSNYGATEQPSIVLVRGSTYKFWIGHSSNGSHDFRLGTSAEGDNYTGGGWTAVGNNGDGNWSYRQIVIPSNAPDRLYYRCGNHAGMGGAIYVLSASAHSSVDCTLDAGDDEKTWKNIISSINAVFPRLNVGYDDDAADDRDDGSTSTDDDYMPDQKRARIEFTGSTNSGSYDDTKIITSGSSWSGASHVTGAYAWGEGIKYNETFSIYWGSDPENPADGLHSLNFGVQSKDGSIWPYAGLANTPGVRTYVQLSGSSTGSTASGAGWEHTSSVIWNTISQSLKDTGQYTFTTSSGGGGKYKIFHVTSSYYSTRFNFDGSTAGSSGFATSSAAQGFDIRTQMVDGTNSTNHTHDGSGIEFSSSILGVTSLRVDTNGWRKNDNNVDKTVHFYGAYSDDNTGRANLLTSLSSSLMSLTGSDGVSLYQLTPGTWGYIGEGSYNRVSVSLTSTITGSDKNFGYLNTVGSPTGSNHVFEANPSNVVGGVTHVPTVYWRDYLNVKPTEQKAFDEGVRQKTVITSRFSAPGGPEVQTESFLDVYAKEYSVHNAIPFRNLLVKNDSGDKFEIDRRSTKALHSNDDNIDGSTRTSVLSTSISTDSTSNSISLAFWIKLDEGVPASKDRIIFQGKSGLDVNSYLKITGDVLELQIDASYMLGWTYYIKRHDWSATIDLDTFSSWTHVVVTWNEKWTNTSTKLYVNGQYQSYMTGTKTGAPSTGIHNKISYLSFFNAYSKSNGDSLQGAMCEFGWWAGSSYDVLALSDVQALYNDGEYKDQTTHTANDTGCTLRGYWHFGEYDSNFDSVPLGSTDLSDLVAQDDDSSADASMPFAGMGKFNIVSGPFIVTTAERGVDSIRVNSHASRREGLNTLHARHTGRAGVDSRHGLADSSDFVSPLAGGQYEASFHKVHRNTLVRPSLSGSNQNPSDDSEILKIVEKRNNFYFQSHLPASDYNYSWVTSSLGDNYSVRSGKQKVFGYWPKDGMLMINPLTASSGRYKNQITASTHVSAINFPSASQILGS
jgi:hypothetical protein